MGTTMAMAAEATARDRLRGCREEINRLLAEREGGVS